MRGIVPRAPQRAVDGAEVYLQVRLPGWLKNQVIDHCETLGCSLNAWLVEALRSGLRAGQGLPEPPPARAPLPTVADQIRAWAAGESIMTPCGRVGSCPGTESEPWSHDGMGFCTECGIRVT